MANKQYFIGLMSGTSLDGVDAVITDLSKKKSAKLLTYRTHPIPRALRLDIQSIIQPNWQGTIKNIGSLNHRLGLLFSNAVNALLDKSGLNNSDILAVGSHGQTLWHQPDGKHPFSLQLGDASLIAEKTGITTVSDFRSRDIAAGGQGAPLVPAFHGAMLNHSHKNRIVLNIGGIANISVLPPKESDIPISGFDTGPGNGLIDAWILKNKKRSFDADGEWARSGIIIDTVLKSLLNDPYFSLPFPKSTGKEAFNLLWLEKSLEGALYNYPAKDIQASLTELTALSIAKQIVENHIPCEEIYLCGGGVYNSFLVERLKHHLPNSQITSTEVLGIDPNWMEAIAFSWLAQQTLKGKAGNIPEVTGAHGSRILGAIHQA